MPSAGNAKEDLCHSSSLDSISLKSKRISTLISRNFRAMGEKLIFEITFGIDPERGLG
jgi:hypothetical protein